MISLLKKITLFISITVESIILQAGKTQTTYRYWDDVREAAEYVYHPKQFAG